MSHYYRKTVLIQDRFQSLVEKMGVSLLKPATLEKILSKISSSDTERFIQNLELVREALETCFPGNYDIQPKLQVNTENIPFTYGCNKLTEEQKTFYQYAGYEVTGFYAIIRFPTITISNSLNESHEIKNLFVRFAYNVFGGYSGEIYGTRTEVSIHEQSSSYLHSHLGSHTLHKREEKLPWKSFCMGSDTFQMTLNLFRTDPTKEGFEFLLGLLETFLSWESLEGGPYRLMKEISLSEKEIPNISTAEIQTAFDRLYDYQINGYLPSINWQFKDGRYQILDDSSFEKALSKFLNYGDTKRGVALLKDSHGEYRRLREVTPKELGKGNLLLTFRGEKFYVQITGDPFIQSPTEREYYLHPKLKNYVKSALEYSANLQKIIAKG